jgi:hypothetical protein
LNYSTGTEATQFLSNGQYMILVSISGKKPKRKAAVSSETLASAY